MRPILSCPARPLFLLAVLIALLLAAPLRASGPVTGTYKVVIIQTTYSDDTTRLHTVAQLTQAAGEIHDFYNQLSFGALDMQVSVTQATLANPKSHYWTACPSKDDPAKMCLTGPLTADAVESAGAGGFDFTGIRATIVLSPCDVYWQYDNWTAADDIDFSLPHARGNVHQIFDTDCAAGTANIPATLPAPGPSGVYWNGWAHELGHSLQLEGNDMFSHPSGYSSGYDLMDSCYPCGESVYSLSGNPIVSDLHKTSFPGWLPSSKVVVIPKPTSGTAGGTYVLEPVNKPDPSASVAPRGIQLPLGGNRSIFVEARTRVAADSHGPGIHDEGVHMYVAEETGVDDHSNPKPLSMLNACDTTVPGGCHNSPADPRYCYDFSPEPYCWPFVLWHPGDTFTDSVDSIIVHVNGKVGDGYGVTVTRNVPPGLPDVFLYPWLTAPMDTYETVDIWVDSSCNGYEDTAGPAGLRYGRRGDGTVIGNGDDPCANHENRIYANVRNGGDATATGITVHFQVTDPLGVGVSGTWVDVGTATIPSLAPGAARVVYVNWTPHVALTEAQIHDGHFNFHSCIQVTIDAVTGEVLTSNNQAQENFDHFEAVRDAVSVGYHVPDRYFFISNNYGMVHGNFTGSTKSDPDFARPIQLRIKSELPHDWNYEVNGGVNEFSLAPHEVRQIPVKVKVPPGTAVAQTFNLRVTAFAQHHMTNPAVPPSSPNNWHFGWMQVAGVVEAVQTVDPSQLTLTAEFHCPDMSRAAAMVPPAQIVVKGKLDPAHNDVIIAIDYTPPGGGATVTHLVHTNAAGEFEDTLSGPAEGVWLVRAIWQGDMDHASAVSDQQKVEVGNCANQPPTTPQAPPPGSTILVPGTAFPGGVLTGVVLGPDDKPVPNTPVEVAGGVPITLTGVVVGDEPPPARPQPDHPAPCQPDAAGNLPPGCPPARPKPAPCVPGAAAPNCPLPTLPPVNAPQDCAAVLQQAQQIVAQPANQGVDHILIGLNQPNVAGVGGPALAPSAAAPGGAPQGAPAGGGAWLSRKGGGIVTDAQGRFAICMGSDPKAFFRSVGGLSTEVEATPLQEGGINPTPPKFVQPNQHINLHGKLRHPSLEQGGNTWLVPAVYALSPDGQQAVTTFKAPRDLQPGPVKFTFTDPNGQQQQFTGGVFKILSATLDRSKLRSQEGADFEYTVQFGNPIYQPCVQVSVKGPVVLVQAPPPQIPLDASGVGRFGGKIRATQVAAGAAIPFDIIPTITDCGPGPNQAPQPNPQSAGTQPGPGSAPPAAGQYTGTTLVNPWGKMPAPTAVKPPSANLSTGPSQVMDETANAAAHEKAPPPISPCRFQTSTPVISTETNTLMPPATFTQQQGLNYYAIQGCNFGDTQGHVYLVFPPATNPGFPNAVELYLNGPWTSNSLNVLLDPNFGGYPDEDGLILRVVTSQGATAELPHRKFRANRVAQTLYWLPRSQVTLGSAGSNWITAAFKTYASSQTALTIVSKGDPGASTEALTATVSRSVNGVGGPFTVQDDLWDFSNLQPGYVVMYAEPFFDNWHGQGCDQTTGYWNAHWDSSALLRVHVQGCYHKGTGQFSSSTAIYGLTVVVRGPQGTLPWPTNLK